MFRHIFIGTFKDTVDDAAKAAEVAALKAIKAKVPGVVDLQVGLGTGWVGGENTVVMTVDFATKADFDGFIAHPYHTGDIVKLGVQNFTGYVAAQFEL